MAPVPVTDPLSAPSPAKEPAVGSPLVGIGLMLLACFLFSGLDATAKYLSQSVSPLQIVWVRFLSHVVLAVFFFRLWQRPEALRPKRRLLQVVRAFTLLCTTIFNFLAVQYLQLAETMSILFAAPFMVTALAGPLLGEWAGVRRWAAIIVGFCGVLLVTQPWSGQMHWAVIYSVCAMVSYAFYMLLTRMLAPTESSISLLMVSGVVAAIAMTPAGLMSWQAPESLFHWGLLLSTGVYGLVGHWILIVAHRMAPASLLAPFLYVQIIWMVILGYLVFDDIPGWSTVAGASVVVASGLYILFREQVLRKR
ncbi:DMT family transporter [Roseibium aestuarii]|uniref:DMT family transporter n=1 Tax=Roseibium aestuarii TaxID=2600299 RepID=UPI00244DDF37|nr:DMT family transporter [Roseibium aestuarii]